MSISAPKAYWHARRDAIMEAIKNEVNVNPENARIFLDAFFRDLYNSCADLENGKIRCYIREKYSDEYFDTVQDFFNNAPYSIENIAVSLSINQKFHFKYNKEYIPKSVISAMKKFALTEKAIQKWKENN